MRLCKQLKNINQLDNFSLIEIECKKKIHTISPTHRFILLQSKASGKTSKYLCDKSNSIKGSFNSHRQHGFASGNTHR